MVQDKCARYFPAKEGSLLRFGDFAVMCNSVTYHKNVLVTERHLSVQFGREEKFHELTHLQFKWPDHGVPKTTRRLFICATQSTSTNNDGASDNSNKCTARSGSSGDDGKTQEKRQSSSIALPALPAPLRYKYVHNGPVSDTNLTSFRRRRRPVRASIG